MLTFIFGAGAAAWILSRIKIIAVIAALFAVSNTGFYFYGYFRGHNVAATACKMNTVLRERDEARRDLKVAADTGAKLKNELAERDKRLADADRRTAEYAAQLQRQQEALDAADRKAAQSRPKSCPACPAVRRCVVD